MNKYIIYTPQGWCEDPNGNDVHNCQLLGRSYGENKEDAINRLFTEEQWIAEHGFDKEECQAVQLHKSESV